MVKKGLLIISVCCMLSGCAAVTSLLDMAGHGEKTNKSINVKTTAAVGTGDANNSLVNKTNKTSYGKNSKVTNNGVEVRPISFFGVMAGQATFELLLLLTFSAACIIIVFLFLNYHFKEEKLILKLKSK